ncbi:MAG: hypothetical protein WCV69_00020 [Patescibacteria group bacterium]|jgi:hypothetical protein
MENQKQDYLPNKTTGTDQLVGQSPLTNAWSDVEKQAQEDSKASALINLRETTSYELGALREEGKIIKLDLIDYQKSLKRVDNLLLGAIVVIAVAFITTISLVFFDLIKEKDLYLRYNDLYQKYSEESAKLKDEINNQKIEINNLGNKIEILKARNTYLK